MQSELAEDPVIGRLKKALDEEREISRFSAQTAD